MALDETWLEISTATAKSACLRVASRSGNARLGLLLTAVALCVRYIAFEVLNGARDRLGLGQHAPSGGNGCRTLPRVVSVGGGVHGRDGGSMCLLSAATPPTADLELACNALGCTTRTSTSAMSSG